MKKASKRELAYADKYFYGATAEEHAQYAREFKAAGDVREAEKHERLAASKIIKK